MKSWIAVVTDRPVRTTDQVDYWWCFPGTASEGDAVYLYCPASTDPARQGIFAKAHVTSKPKPEHINNVWCSGYKCRLGRLFYCAISIEQRFAKRLKASQMKTDVQLSQEDFVRRNFQGTVFLVSEEGRARIEELIREL